MRMVFLPCMYVHQVDACVGVPGTWVTDGYKLPYGCWKTNPSPLQEEQVLLRTESCLQTLKYILTLVKGNL